MAMTCFVWSEGERNRPLALYRTCSCGVCKRGRKGVGYLSSSNAQGKGFTVWIDDERVFRRLARLLNESSQGRSITNGSSAKTNVVRHPLPHLQPLVFPQDKQ